MAEATQCVQRLHAERLPLYGVHLIEASAGTGKTFNITRIYLRLLLERKLKVQNILVVTFTKAATEELRGRIHAEISKTLQEWGSHDSSDHFYATLEKNSSFDEANAILREALVHMDEAAIFTIHGFCKRVLSQQAFSSGLPFDLDMEVDSYEIKLEATRDWYRQLKQSPQKYLLVSSYWATPDEFAKTFGSLFVDGVSLASSNPQAINDAFETGCRNALERLQSVEDLIFGELINGHKDQDKRAIEYSSLIEWLGCGYEESMPKTASSVFDGKRYARKPSEIKDRLNSVFQPIKHLKKQRESLASLIERATADEFVVEAIQHITSDVVKRKHNNASLDFDDLIIELLRSLKSSHGPLLTRHLLAQYPVALVDEFQDTDPNQYAIFKEIYKQKAGDDLLATDPNSALYMIGDPKQAIYGFRGGDVFTYLAARADADMQWFMDTNWRSSSSLITAYNRLFYGQSIVPVSSQGAPNETTHVFKYDIGYIPVGSSKTKDNHCVVNNNHPALKYIYFEEHEDYGKGNNNQNFREVIARWCAREIKQLLDREALLEENDIAILVRDRTEAEDIQSALKQQGCMSVYLSNRENVFASIEAHELLRLLTGILLAENDRLLVAALAGAFMGYDTERLYRLQTDETLWEECRLLFTTMRAEWQSKGIMSTLFGLIHKHYRPSADNNERSLTNTIHLLELLQHASQKHRQPWELLTWFRDKIDNLSSDTTSELRLDSDSNLIKIITLHGSKGLEYPVVFVPFATRAKASGNRSPSFYRYHDKQTKQSISYIGSTGVVKQLAEDERLAEDVRLLYVAITRAEQACYVCATPFSGYEKSPLGQMLGLSEGDDLEGALTKLATDTPADAELVFASPHDEATATRVVIDSKNDPLLKAEKFNGSIEDNWWVASFSSIVRNALFGIMGTLDRDVDEQLIDIPLTQLQQEQQSSFRFVLTKGAMTGNLLHDILENVDFNNPDWEAGARAPLLRFGLLEADKHPQLHHWLEQCIDSELFTGMSLSGLRRYQTLKETEFYFPIAEASRAQLSGLLEKHRGDGRTVSLPSGGALNGMMHGFIDLIFEWEGKYYIADYKSNYLGDTFDSYGSRYLSESVQEHYYDLQYLIYSVALHRYLELRLDDYDPETHLGGVYYLYLRGMSPEHQTGIYYSKIATDLILQLDQFFGRVV